jgi:hypothetical protein
MAGIPKFYGCVHFVYDFILFFCHFFKYFQISSAKTPLFFIVLIWNYHAAFAQQFIKFMN